MVKEQQNDTLDNFGIQDTMDLGLSNASLLDSFLNEGSDTTTANSDDLIKIVKEVPDDAQTNTTQQNVPAKKDVPVTADKTSTDDVPSPTAADMINTFLEDEETENADDDGGNGTKVDVKPKTTEKQPSKDGNDNSPNFEALANDLFELGVFTKEDEDENGSTLKDPQSFLDKFQSEKKRGALEMVNNFIGQFGDDYQQMFEAIFVKGADPKEYLSVYNNITDISELDLTIESNQEKVIRQGLKEQGFDSEDIDNEIERYKSYGDLESVATRLQKVLVKKEATKLADIEQKSEQDLRNRAAIKNQYVQNVQTILQEKLKTKEFDGIPVNPKLAAEIQDFLLVDKYKTASGETLTDFDKAILEMKRPENHGQKVKIALLLKLLEKDPTLSTIQKSGVSNNTNKLFNSLATQQTVVNNKNTTVNSNTKSEPRSWFS